MVLIEWESSGFVSEHEPMGLPWTTEGAGPTSWRAWRNRRTFERSLLFYSESSDVRVANRPSGLLRQFFPKGTRLQHLSRAEIKREQVMLNDRPREVLNWHSPAHAFHKLWR
jgi:hypothetical protein